MLFTDNSLRWLESILKERFGCPFAVREVADALLLTLPGTEGSIRFDNLQPVFHQSHSDFPCRQWQASISGYKAPIDDFIPAPSENELPAPLIEVNQPDAVIHYDILGLTYWMLTRLEEVGRTDLDEHQRFPAASSHAYKNGYLERPVVDEWLIILGQVIQCVWPQLDLKHHEFSVKVSHDVDSPSMYAFKRWPTIGRMMGGHLLKRRDLRAFLQAPYIKIMTRNKLHCADPFNTFDWLMDESEANNIKSAFYFICGTTDRIRDADYEPEHPVIRNLMRRIHERGHEIGLHPSYGTFNKPNLVKQEAARLKRICAEEGIKQSEWGGRMHYLRWEQPTTLNAWAESGMKYDSTLGYADSPGFRSGTCYEYPAFDPVGQKQMTLRIRPLVVMECTVIDPLYLGLGLTNVAEKKIQELKQKCRLVSGSFSFLWHNSYLHNPDCKVVYSNVLQ